MAEQVVLRYVLIALVLIFGGIILAHMMGKMQILEGLDGSSPEPTTQAPTPAQAPSVPSVPIQAPAPAPMLASAPMPSVPTAPMPSVPTAPMQAPAPAAPMPSVPTAPMQAPAPAAPMPSVPIQSPIIPTAPLELATPLPEPMPMPLPSSSSTLVKAAAVVPTKEAPTVKSAPTAPIVNIYINTDATQVSMKTNDTASAAAQPAAQSATTKAEKYNF